MRVPIDEMTAEIEFRIQKAKSLREKTLLQNALENLKNYKNLLESKGTLNEPRRIEV